MSLNTPLLYCVELRPYTATFVQLSIFFALFSLLESFGQNYPEVSAQSYYCTSRRDRSLYYVHFFSASLRVYCVYAARRQMAPWIVLAWPSPVHLTGGARCWQWAATMVVLLSGISWHVALPKLSVHIFTQCALYGETCFSLYVVAI